LPWLGLAKSKVLAADLIEAGLIYVNGKKSILRGRPVGEGDIISVDPFFYNEMQRANRRSALRALYNNLFAHSGLLAGRVISKAAAYFVSADEGLTGFRPGASRKIKKSSVADVKQMLFSINIKNILTGGRVGFLQKIKADRAAFGRIFQADLKEYVANVNYTAFAKYFSRAPGSSYLTFIKNSGYDSRVADFVVRFRNSAILRRFPAAPEQLYRASEVTPSGRLLYFYNPTYWRYFYGGDF
jgi:hypothetical protein